jgi:hypothetical protein
MTVKELQEWLAKLPNQDAMVDVIVTETINGFDFITEYDFTGIEGVTCEIFSDSVTLGMKG